MTRCGTTVGTTLRLIGALALLAGWAIFAAPAAAQDEENDPALNVDLVADVIVEGGDAVGGDASGGDAAVVMEAGNTSGGQVEQSVAEVTGGEAIGGNATGGDGLNAYVDANLVVNADVAVDVAADVSVLANVSGDAGIGLPQVPVPVSQQAVTGSATQAQTGEVSEGVADAVAVLDSLVGALGGLQLLDLNADLLLEIAGGDAAGGNADGGSALVELSVGDTSGGNTSVTQTVGTVTGGLVKGGDATGGDGIELDVILDADVDLVVDANVDVNVDVVTFADVAVGTAQLGQVRLN